MHGMELSLLIINPAFKHTMESESSFLTSLFSWSSSDQTPQESALITDLRKNKKKFDKKLTKRYCFIYNGYVPSPCDLLGYCYYPKTFNPLHLLKNLDPSMLEQWHKAQLYDYSSLGAAMLSKHTSIEQKRNFIKTLMTKYDFKPTLKDIGLAQLVLYDGISAEYKKIFLHLLHTRTGISWSALPKEIRTHIAQYMIQLFKKDFWLLPETASDNLLK